MKNNNSTWVAVKKIKYSLLFSLFVYGIGLSTAFAYTPPIGIPAPDFGIDETAPAHPANWPATEAVGYYYIDSDHTAATDENNDYGFPDKPRISIPYNTTLAAGSYIEVAPSTSTYPGGNLRFDCSLAQPCWFRGADQSNMPTFTSLILLQQGQYAIVENLNISGSGTERVGITLGHPGSDYSSSHYSVRNNTISNNVSGSSNGSALGFYPGANSTITDIVFYNNTVIDAQAELGVSVIDGIRITGRDGGDERVWKWYPNKGT